MASTNFGPERAAQLLDLAYEGSDVETPGLNAAERDELVELRSLLDIIDASWQSTAAERGRVRDLFLQQLAETHPLHPWVSSSTVQTLGELVRIGDEAIPNLSEASYNELVADTTPVEVLLDPARRTTAVGQALRRAQVPPSAIGSFLLWLNATIVDLIPRPGTERGLMYTRRPGRRHGRRRL